MKFLYKKALHYHTGYDNPESKDVFLLSGAYNYKKERHARTSVQTFTTLEFEGKMYPVPKNYDAFLREEYGDYMTLPPPEERVNPSLVDFVDFGDYDIQENL